MEGVLVILFLILISYWLTPIILIIIGFTRLKSNPQSAKSLFIYAGIILTIGIGVCGYLMNIG